MSGFRGNFKWHLSIEEVLDIARQRARNVLHEENPKLTVLERGFWQAMRDRM